MHGQKKFYNIGHRSTFCEKTGKITFHQAYCSYPFANYDFTTFLLGQSNLPVGEMTGSQNDRAPTI
jgi:hypothetical protein